ncbi:hypothetical protein BKA67DRAFT_589404 [Truncatella angustata]|uniref:Uncharacterized protein n=1 Tax=Truncatella angustata TaxID=152316 RepID=A0A9P8UUC1_9PEZI|nr:uncharacterized protein BKA67DRAFT_589404 [Truncatella angustata]KAH6659289.1 hypothetical protein BKA67DRAFT_589404 [Truncatella angustata]
MAKTNAVNNSDPFGIFAARGTSAPKILSLQAVKCEAKDRSADIFRNYRRLQSILQLHEAAVQKRWEKRTRTQRLSILLGCWPEMPATHRPDFAAFRKHAGNLNAVAVQHRGSFIWPSINQEDLGDPKTLPLLLDARGRTHPNESAAADGEAMHLRKVTMAIVPIFLNQYVMILNGVTQQEDYGRLVAWDEHEDAFDWMHTRKQFLPGEGLLILEHQQRVLQFLVQCCQKILHDIPLEQMTSDAFAIQPEPQLKISVDASGLSSLAVLAKEAPYRPPTLLDLDKIESLLAARTARAENHVWALREDPSYFAEALLEIKEHRQEMIKDIRGDIHPILKCGRGDILWARVIGTYFAELRDQAQLLGALQRKYDAAISPDRDLPEEYLNALLKFRHYLNQTAVAASPPLRNLFVRNVPEYDTSSKIEVMSKQGIKLDKVAGQLIWLLRTLWEDGTDLFFCRLTIVVDELDRLLRSEPKALELVSPYVAMLIGELSIVGECLRQLELYQPWANGFENASHERDDAIKRQFSQRTKGWGGVMEAFRDRNLVGLSHLGDPSDGKFQYPLGKRRNQANVEALRAAEANLDAFWNAVDVILNKQPGNLDGTAYKQMLSQPRYLQRTLKWIEPAAKKDQTLNTNQSFEDWSSQLAAPLSRLNFGPEPPVSARKEILAAGGTKAKIKSHGAPSAMSAASAEEAVLSTMSLGDSQPTFAVDARALKVFRIIFFDPAANTTAGEVVWKDFLHAMDSTGFSAQKLYGSVWHFQPTKLDVERSIQFHEPHPHPKIPFLVARRHGRRLNRAYGWLGSMFVLKEKTTS